MSACLPGAVPRPRGRRGKMGLDPVFGEPVKDAPSACAAIGAASTESEVISIVRTYLASQSAEKAVMIPGDVVALGINHAREIAQAALEVARREALIAADAPEASFLKDVGAVLSTAAMRLIVLATGIEGATA